MSSEHKLNCLLACVHPLRQLSSAAKLCQPCRTTATSWGESIRHLLKLEKHSSPTDYLLYKNQYACLCGVQLNLVCLITHTRACKQLWQEHAERHKSTDINTHFLTHTHTHSFYRSHWDCVCCVLPDLSMSLSAWVSFFFLSSFLPGGHLCSALPSVLHAVEHGAPSGCRRFHTVAKIVNWS